MSDLCGIICGVKHRSTDECVCSAKHHVICCPEYRRRPIGGRVGIRLKQIVSEVAAERGGEVIGLGTMPGHVRLPMEVPPTVALPGLMQRLKGRSSRQLRAEFGHLRRRVGNRELAG